MPRDNWPDDFDDGRRVIPARDTNNPVSSERRGRIAAEASGLNALWIKRPDDHGNIEVDLERTIVARRAYVAEKKLPRTSIAYPMGFGITEDERGLLVFRPLVSPATY